jgi:TRAP-type C4-dicarboxylate transport system substrate-binding protein
MLTRRLVTAALAAPTLLGGTAFGRLAQAQQTRWRVNTAYESQGYGADMLRWFAERIRQGSNGRLTLDLHFSSSLGFRPDNSLQSVSQGLAEMNFSYIAAGEERLAAFVYMPFLFDRQEDWIKWGYESYRPMLDRRLRDRWRVQVLSLFTFPDVRIWSSRPLTRLEDFRGLKIRAPGGLPTGRLMTELGATVVAIPTAEVYTALQRGVADALQTSAVTFTEQRLWEVAKFTLQPALSGDMGNALVVSNAALQRLPPELREVVIAAGAELERHALEMFRSKYNAELNAKVTENGVQFVEADPTLRQHLSATMPQLYRRWAAEIGADGEQLIRAAGKWG